LGVHGGYQVGWARNGIGGTLHAGVWNGSAASWFDLQDVMPAGYVNSMATGIWVDGGGTYVSGSAFNSATGRTEAVLWTNPVPEPGTLIVLAIGVIGLVTVRRRR
jgi:hypothetical protein